MLSFTKNCIAWGERTLKERLLLLLSSFWSPDNLFRSERSQVSILFYSTRAFEITSPGAARANTSTPRQVFEEKERMVHASKKNLSLDRMRRSSWRWQGQAREGITSWFGIESVFILSKCSIDSAAIESGAKSVVLGPSSGNFLL